MELGRGQSNREPPVLNLPQKGAVIKESNIPSILFSWTPRHMNSIAAAYGTEYDISLVEIYDKQVAPEAAFDYSRVFYTETTKSTSFIHTVAQPLLIPGMRYAWRVQAKAREGVDEISVFKNNGYSPVSWFDYTADCKTVQSCGAIYENGHVDISWQDVGAMEYTVEYRKKGTGRWYTGTINKPLLSQLYNLQAGKDYEYRIGSRCVAGDTFLYNNPQAFHIPARQENGSDCGLMPDISLSNRTPARELQSGMPVLVGDFPVFITKVSGSGRFTGEGYVGIPYLQGTQIAVTFKDIVVNTDNRLVEGFFETKYDTKNNNLLFDADEYQTGGKDITDEVIVPNLDYVIDANVTGKYKYVDNSKDEIKEGEDYQFAKGENGYYIVTLTDTEGNEHELNVDSLPATVVDKEGNEYEVKVKEGVENGVVLSEVITSTEASNNLVAFRIRNNVYNNGSKFTMLISAAIPDIQITTQDSIRLDSLNYYFEGRNNLNVQLKKDTISSDSIKYYLKLSDYSTNLKNGSKVVVKKGNNKVSELKIETYDAPYVKFDIGNNFNGEYFFDKGFDEQSTLKSPTYYDTIHVKGNVYYAPVLGVNVNKEATIKVDLKDFDSKIANDTTFRIIIKSRINGLMLLNGQNDSLVVNRTELENIKNNGLTIQSLRAIAGATLTPAIIDVMIKSTREKVGQLEYYSATPVNKQVQLVYVKFADEASHPNYTTPAVLQTYLNSQSMNQLFINFIVDSIQVNSTLNTAFFVGKSTRDIIMEMYTDVVARLSANSFDNIDYDCYFVTNLNIPSGAGYLGGAHFTGSFGGYSTKNNSRRGETNEELITHELGHWIGLPHTFESNGNVPIIINSTQRGTVNNGNNFMDYDLIRRRWFKIQLLNYNRTRVK